MRKKTLCLLLALVMVFSLLPTFALNAAAVVTNPAQADKDDLHMDKTLVPQENGTYNIVLRSWSTGVYSEEQQLVPKATDYILVLDLSESMSETNLATEFEATTDATFEQSFKYTTTNDPVFIKTADGKYRQLIDPSGKYGNYHAYYVDDDYNLVCITSKATNYTDYISQNLLDDYAGTTIYRKKTTESRLQGLKDAVEAFLEQIHAADQGLDKYRVAVTGFSGKTYIYSNGQVTEYSQAQYDGKTNPADPLKYVTSEYADLTASKDALATTSSKETYTNYGLQTAYNILNARTEEEKADRDAVVLLFSDGLPNQADHGVAMINTAKDLEKDFGATVFSISVYKGSDYQAVENWYDKDDLAQAKTYVWQVFEAISSNYPDAVAVQGGAYDVEQCKITLGERDSRLYYTLAGDSKALEEAFKEVVETSTSTDSTVTANAKSTLTDIINTVNFSVENASVKSVMVEPVKLANADEKNAQPVSNGAMVPFDAKPGDVSFENGTLNVKGFDYSATENIVTTNGGNRLVVTIQGLIPLKAGDITSNTKAGIYPELGDVLLEIDPPTENIPQRTYVIDFNAKMKLAEEAMISAKDDGHNGIFSENGGTVTYQLKPTTTISGGADLSFANAADSAMVFGNFYSTARADDAKNAVETGAKKWLQVNAVPADNVYFDDDLRTGDAMIVSDGSGYNCDVQFENANAQAAGKYSFTFTGTGVDVYCTTNATSGTIVAKLLDKDENVVAQSRKNMYNHSETERYNIPTIWYRDLDYGTYTVVLTVLDGVEYNLDGVRVYNPTNNGTQFANLREALINDASKSAEAVTITSEDALDGVLFVDDETKLAQEQPQIDGNTGKPTGKTVKVYNTTFDAYKAVGPKNEIYLAPGELITFQLKDEAQTADGLWIGLSAPDFDANGAGSVKITTDDVQSVDSAVDMYYPITDAMIGEKGTVTITNAGTTMISVTNLKVVGLSVGEGESLNDLLFAPITERTLKIAANNGIDPDLEKDGWADNAWNPKQMLNALFELLMKSLSGLFNGLGNW